MQQNIKWTPTVNKLDDVPVEIIGEILRFMISGDQVYSTSVVKLLPIMYTCKYIRDVILNHEYIKPLTAHQEANVDVDKILELYNERRYKFDNMAMDIDEIGTGYNSGNELFHVGEKRHGIFAENKSGGLGKELFHIGKRIFKIFPEQNNEMEALRFLYFSKLILYSGLDEYSYDLFKILSEVFPDIHILDIHKLTPTNILQYDESPMFDSIMSPNWTSISTLIANGITFNYFWKFIRGVINVKNNIRNIYIRKYGHGKLSHHEFYYCVSRMCRDISTLLTYTQNQLRTLDLSVGIRNREVILQLFKNIQDKNCKLQTLDISNCNLDSETLVNSIKKNHIICADKLINLNISNLLIADANKPYSVKLIADAMYNGEITLERFTFNSNKLIDIKYACIQTICMAFSKHNITVLEFVNNELDKQSLDILAEELNNPAWQLKLLTIKERSLFDTYEMQAYPGTEFIINPVVRALNNKNSLIELNITEVANPGRRRIDENKINEYTTNFIKLIHNVVTNTSITALCIEDENISLNINSMDIVNMFKHKQNNLKKISIIGSQMYFKQHTPENYSFLTMQHCKLEEITFSKINKLDKGLVVFLQYICWYKNNRLKKLNLDHTYVAASDIYDMLTAKYCKVEHLSIHSTKLNHDSTEKQATMNELYSLFANSRSLQELYVGENSLITTTFKNFVDAITSDTCIIKTVTIINVEDESNYDYLVNGLKKTGHNLEKVYIESMYVNDTSARIGNVIIYNNVPYTKKTWCEEINI